MRWNELSIRVYSRSAGLLSGIGNGNDDITSDINSVVVGSCSFGDGVVIRMVMAMVNTFEGVVVGYNDCDDCCNGDSWRRGFFSLTVCLFFCFFGSSGGGAMVVVVVRRT